MKKRFYSDEDPTRLVPAAQYIRMSTEHQRYSPDNQRAAIAEYALERGFEIVETYQDSGKSGLSLRGRDELKRLLADVLKGSSGFKAILVLDVSRWGRFQDIDQSAHYEFMCRAAGVEIHYCAEPFENEGGTISSIVKHMKRVMAAEYSRELSTKISRAQRHRARLGFKQGGPSPFGLRRQVIDENGVPRMMLEVGQHKALNTDHVILVHGPQEEIKVVKQIFRNFVVKGMRLGEIASWLNEKGHRHPNGNLWQTQSVRTVLSNELYIGNYVFGKTYNNLGKKPIIERTDVSRVRIMDPIVSPKLFSAARRRLIYVTRRQWSMTEIKSGLEKLLKEEGRLSTDLIEPCHYLPRSSCVANRFGGLAKAFRAVGFEMPSRLKKNKNGLVYTDEELLEELRRIYRERGYISRHAIDMDESSPCGRFYIRRFGGLIPAFRLAGFDVTATSQKDAAALRRHAVLDAQGLPRQRPPVRGVSDSEIIDGLRRLFETHGYLSLQLIDADTSLPSVGTINRRLGPLQSLYKQVGFAGSLSEIMRAARVRHGLPILAVPRTKIPRRPWH